MAAPSINVSPYSSFNHMAVVQANLTPAAVGAATVVEQTFTIAGLQFGDSIQAGDQAMSVSKAAHQVGLALANVRVSAANTIAITFTNPTAGSITPTAGELYTFVLWRPCALPLVAPVSA